MRRIEMIYYLRNKLNNVVATVCIEKLKNKFNRGIAIVSPKDTPNKKLGRKIATERCHHANKYMKRLHNTVSTKQFSWLLTQLTDNTCKNLENPSFLFMKSQYDIWPTEFEKRLLKRYQKVEV
jgi:hypothetical protein